MIEFWTAATTLILFASPAGRQIGQLDNDPVPAVGPHQLFSAADFHQLWMSFFGEPASSPRCGLPQDLSHNDSDLIGQDVFLVQRRGFRQSICRPEAWFLAAMRIDPCRLRLHTENTKVFEIQTCSKGGMFSEVRFVLQAVEKTDRGFVFPDASLHISYTIPKFSSFAAQWRRLPHLELISAVRKVGKWNDASLFLGGAGLERWTFARARYEKGAWKKDRLPHGGFFESLSDADLNSAIVRTARPANEKKFDSKERLLPLKINPLQGSCVDCHLADQRQPVRLFRQMGWGFQGESVLSERVRAEAEFAARELNILGSSFEARTPEH